MRKEYTQDCHILSIPLLYSHLNKMSSPRILVIGATGLVGNALQRVWQRAGAEVVGATYHCHPGPGYRQLDIQDEAAVGRLLDAVVPSLVALPAANPYVDQCELEPAATRSVNVTGTLGVARLCAAAGIPLIFFSSDYVFDGTKEIWTQQDKVCPLNEYGRQKAEAEAGVLGASASNLVIRTAGAFGWQWEPKNFVLQVLSRLKAGGRIKVSNDVHYNPTFVENLAEVVVALAAAGAGGLFHVVGADTFRRDEFARLAAGAFGLDPAGVLGVSSDEFQAPAKRPRKSVLSTAKVRAAVKTPILGMAAALALMKEGEAAWRAYAEVSLPRAGGA